MRIDLSQITYLQAEMPNSGPVVQIVSMKEFIQLVEAKQVAYVYRIAAIALRKSFAFVSDGAVFRVDAHGFQNLVDAEKAVKLGLSTNADLQVAERFDIKKLDSLFYVNRKYFGSEQEYRTAMSEGFRGSSMGLRSLVLPERMGAQDFSVNLLPQMAWYFLSLGANQRGRFEIPQSSPDGVTAGAARPLAKLGVILDNAGIQPTGIGPGRTITLRSSTSTLRPPSRGGQPSAFQCRSPILRATSLRLPHVRGISIS